MKNFLTKLNRYKAIPICIAIILAAMGILLAYIGKRKGLYLEHDYMYGVIDYVILIMALLVYFKNKKVRHIYWIIVTILIIANTVLTYKSFANVQFQKKFAHGENSFIVKETKNEPNYSLVYVKSRNIFIRLIDKIKIENEYKPFFNNAYEVIWIKDEKAIIKYSYGSTANPKCHILNFTKVNGAYSNVLGSLEGQWIDRNNKGNTLTFDRGQITYKNGKEIYWYSSSMADEQGSYGSILYGSDSTPTLYILKNADNTITLGYVQFKNNKQSIYIRQN